jgi:hypothetical protein
VPPRFCLVCLFVILAAGCERPSLTDKLQGAWAVQTVNGQPAASPWRGRVAVVFLNDGTFQRGGDVGTFDVIDGGTILTRIGDRVEVLTVDASGDTLTIRTAEGVVTVMAKVKQ